MPPTASIRSGTARKILLGAGSAVSVFFVECGLNIYHGMHALLQHQPVEPFTPLVLGLLLFALALESFTFVVALREIGGWKGLLANRHNTTVLAVVLEDAVALLGFVLPLIVAGVSFAWGPHPAFDAAVAIAVGALLGAMALFLAAINRRLLIDISDVDLDRAAQRFLADQGVTAEVSSVVVDDDHAVVFLRALPGAPPNRHVGFVCAGRSLEGAAASCAGGRSTRSAEIPAGARAGRRQAGDDANAARILDFVRGAGQRRLRHDARRLVSKAPLSTPRSVGSERDRDCAGRRPAAGPRRAASRAYSCSTNSPAMLPRVGTRVRRRRDPRRDRAVDQEQDRELIPVERWFLYMPFVHAESPAAQARSLALFTRLAHETGLADPLVWAEKHAVIIGRFGRYPHRNASLDRASTAEEIAFLGTQGSNF